MAFSTQTHTVSGSALSALLLTIGFLRPEHLSVTDNGTPTVAYSVVGDTVMFSPSIPVGHVVVVSRTTPQEAPLNTFDGLAQWRPATVDESFLQLLYLVQERDDALDAALMSIADAGNYFASSTVEDALQELGAQDGTALNAHVVDASDPHSAAGYAKQSGTGDFAGGIAPGGYNATSNPRVRTKKLTGTTPATANANVVIAHGLDVTKITRPPEVLVSSSDGRRVGPQCTYEDGSADYTYEVYTDATNVSVYLKPGVDTGYMCSRPITIWITYEV